MDSQLEDRIRATFNELADTTKISPNARFDARTTQAVETRTDRRRWAMPAAAAVGSLALVGGLITLAREDRAPAPTTEQTLPPPTTALADPEPTILASPPPTATPASTAPETDPSDETPRTLDELRSAQATALAGLTGFSATVEFSTPADGADAIVRTSQITLLADGSFWAEGDDQSWASYDPATQTERMLTPKEDGSFDTLDLVANGGNYLSTSQYFGSNPTDLVTAYGDMEIAETAFEGRPAWILTSVATYEQPPATSVPGSDSTLPVATETTRQVVDIETGLVVDATTSSTGYVNFNSSQRTVLSNITITDQLPAAFPGRFPEGNEPEPGGNEPRRVVTAAEAVDLFGLPLPIPDGTLESGTRLTYDEGDYYNGIDSEVSAGVNRLVAIEFRTGFRSEFVTISASAPDDPASVLDWQTVIDGYQCTDNDGDGACDNAPQNYLSYPDGGVLDVDTITISGGALHGTTAIVNQFGLSLEFGVFLIGIEAATLERAIEIAETFILLG